MSEVGKQLVENERKRGDCYREARRIVLGLVEKLAIHDEDALADLDCDQMSRLVGQLATKRQILRNLRREYGELQAAAAE